MLQSVELIGGMRLPQHGWQRMQMKRKNAKAAEANEADESATADYGGRCRRRRKQMNRGEMRQPLQKIRKQKSFPPHP